MENSADSYLHKKFKKQLSIEPKSQNYDKENKDSARVVEPSEEKISEPNKQGECNKVTESRIRVDNNDSVPNQSTNQNSSFVLNISNLSKSSISAGKCVANQQSSKSCISYVVSNNQNNEEHCNPISFDTTFSTLPTNSTISTPIVSTSSILNNLYSKENYGNKDDVSTYNSQEDFSLKLCSSDDNFDVKIEEIQPPPDRNSSGKYVCTYCNLVCSKPSVLQKHIRAHTNERPYPCISCGFSFKTRSNLYKHCRSRTHANRVMGNKSQHSSNELDNQKNVNLSIHQESREENACGDVKLKPYKPRFHTSKHFLDNVSKENVDDEKQNSKQATSELLSHHINEIINKNNSIVNSRESTFIKKRINDLSIVDNVNNNEYVQKLNRSDSMYSPSVMEQNNLDEPLNLTNKNRKRCMSEISEPIAQKSLIKELLLKNLYSSDMQCPYCKMIFQTVTELDVHKYRNCKGKPLGARYTRSSSVNVASILTQNKNAFDNIPQLQNTVFPLNSPGPFLGKTRLVETDKTKSFSFDSGNLPLMSPNEISQNYLSPLPFDKEKKTPVKLFGGEVKIHSLGETKSYKIDNKEDKCEPEQNYVEYGGKLSENRVIKSSLQSGGTVLTNKTNYSKQDIRTQQDVIRVYENTSVSPSIDISGISKTKFNFERQCDGIADSMQPDITLKHNIVDEVSKTCDTVSNSLYKYTNIMDFSQKAVKMLTPNIKQPTLSIQPPSNVFNKLLAENHREELLLDNLNSKLTIAESDIHRVQNLKINPDPDVGMRSPSLKKQVLQKKGYYDQVSGTGNLCNPVNLLVNGKVIRYVPGMPGPIVTEDPVEMPYENNIISVGRPTPRDLPPASPIVQSKLEVTNDTFKTSKSNFSMPVDRTIEKLNRSPKIGMLEIKTDFYSKSPEIKSPLKTNDTNSPTKITEIKSPEKDTVKENKKFARPNSLALKPTTASLKQHHGLTPTMFNQILISPDTPRVAKKYAEHFLHGNYFSYLGLKSSTRPVYCTLNKTQPFYVPHFKKLSMYSEWRQQDTKTDKLYVTNYDSRQTSQKYTMAGKTSANLIIHSSYRFVVSEVSSSKTETEDEQQKNKNILGGYECNDDYTYIRGRGRGRYVCDQCGIRCKKPSMLKKHIRTHSNDRPYTCSHCNFSFKTKGNLTKHMKSKAHTKNSTVSSGSGSSTQQSATPSSESDTDDSGMDSSDESTRQQEHEAAYGLLSLSQKPTQTNTHSQSDTHHLQGSNSVSINELFMSSEEIAYVTKTSYAKNKILDERNSLSFTSTSNINHTTVATISEETTEARNLRNFLGKSSVNRPLTYPYMSTVSNEVLTPSKSSEVVNDIHLNNMENNSEMKCIKQFHVIQKYAASPMLPKSPKMPGRESPKLSLSQTERNVESTHSTPEKPSSSDNKNLNLKVGRVLPTLKINDVVVPHENISDLRKRKFPVVENDYKNKMQRNDEVMDLSMPSVVEKHDKNHIINGITENYAFQSNMRPMDHPKIIDSYNAPPKLLPNRSPEKFVNEEDEYQYEKNENVNSKRSDMGCNDTVIILAPLQSEDHVNVNYIKEQHNSNASDYSKSTEYDNSAMETLADVATQREKLDKNTLAQSVATEFLKLATKNEKIDGCRDTSGYSLNKDVNDLIVKAEGNKSCTICSKNFNKPSQLRLHMNIHYLERPFRCDSCSVSFRTKGHLQKHERSASHHNKLSSTPALSSSEPRPFKCTDCNIAFRIHGHLAKHLRSKMHIMKLECLAKIPFGLYAELERSNSLLTEINTCDGDQCLESLKTLAKKVFINDPNKLNQLELRKNDDADS
ncbi:uncharacterized protein LOC108904712 [Anoplophora glabripennis]|uniref:uncharacterized protein LOC108904712 n=1 Tax=Anoplophora glabripennis TaxID=217634 RepID=UPI0008754B11|nr:uncharacterized protein LOC108904712 [Anoplophora glabripennis]